MTIPAQSNRLLTRLPPKDLKRLRAVLEPARLALGEVLQHPGEKIRHVYFPTTGVISIIVNMTTGGSAAAGMVGTEGVLGLWVAFGAGTSPFEAVVQAPVEMLRMPAATFATEVERSRPLWDLLCRYTDTFLTMTSQTAACNRLHTAGQRFCRWLLMTRDRVEADEFPLTQEFLARILGVRRMSLIPPARKLQQAGLIRYTRGRMTILDRAGLEVAACECYRVVRARLDALLPP